MTVTVRRPAIEQDPAPRAAVASRSSAEPDLRTAPTSPLRIYTFDHQPIRLLAEIEGVAPAELVHRAVSEYMNRHREALAEIHRRTQEMISAGNLDGLAELLAAARALEEPD